MGILDIIILTMQEKGIQQKDISDFLGLSRNTVSEWKRGKSESYLKHLPKIADYLDVSVDYLLGKTENPNAADQIPQMDETEQYLIDTFRKLDAQGKAKIIQTALNEADRMTK